MRIHSLQHVAFEDIGSMTADFSARGFSLSSTHWYRGDTAPTLGSFDALIVMGGPMGIYDEAIYPWLTAEKQLIKAAIAADKLVLGICLGAQLIADALGAVVSRNAHKEIGWLPLHIYPEANHHPIAKILASYPEVFHWHGDTFALPQGAQALAYSDGCPQQAFAYGARVFGLQFHLETTPDSAQALIEHCSADIDGSRYTQNPAQIMASGDKFKQINQAMSALLAVLFPTEIQPKQPSV